MVFKTGDEHNLSTGKAVSTGRLQPVEVKAVTTRFTITIRHFVV